MLQLVMFPHVRQHENRYPRYASVDGAIVSEVVFQPWTVALSNSVAPANRKYATSSVFRDSRCTVSLNRKVSLHFDLKNGTCIV